MQQGPCLQHCYSKLNPCVYLAFISLCVIIICLLVMYYKEKHKSKNTQFNRETFY